MRDKKPHGFRKTPEEKCTMNYCDDNGCQNRKRVEVKSGKTTHFYTKEDVDNLKKLEDRGIK